jgi:tetratricopeptide (TPR) repeat protein
LSSSGALAPDKIAYAKRAIDKAHNRSTSGAATTQLPSGEARADSTQDAQRLLVNDPDVWLRKGLELVESQDWHDATTCLSQVLALKPNDPDALFDLAQAEDALGAVGPSRKHFRQFLVYVSCNDRGRIAEAQRRLKDVDG